jgi:hypothetical protein
MSAFNQWIADLDPATTDEMARARRPLNQKAISFDTVTVNGRFFRTLQAERNLVTKNCGASVEVYETVRGTRGETKIYMFCEILMILQYQPIADESTYYNIFIGNWFEKTKDNPVYDCPVVLVDRSLEEEESYYPNIYARVGLTETLLCNAITYMSENNWTDAEKDAGRAISTRERLVIISDTLDGTEANFTEDVIFQRSK